MEGSPNDNSSESKDKTKTKDKRSDLGSVAVKRKPGEASSAQQNKTEKPEPSWLDLFNKSKKTNKETAAATLTEKESKPVNEDQAPTEMIGEVEKPAIVAELLRIDASLPEQPANNFEPEVQAAEQAAVDRWKELIIEEQEDPDSAEKIVYAELGLPVEAAEPRDTVDESEPELPDDFAADDEVYLINHQPKSHEGTEDNPPQADNSGGHSGTPPRPPFGATPPGGFFEQPDQPRPLFDQHIDKAQPEKTVEYIDDGGNAAAMALFGGIIGYLIGRRRGRIKTEKKLLPIQKKLEAQVNDLHWQLKEKEAKIRKAAALQARLYKTNINKRPGPERNRAIEAHMLHDQDKAPERIGHMLLSSEAPPSGQQKLELPINKRVETLSRAELLTMSEKVIVDGTSLRRIYETHLISERGLRRLITEHLRGGDMKKALRIEITEREIDFERDPILRDMAVSSNGISTSSVTTPAALDKLLEKASQSLPADEQTAYFKARADYEIKQRQSEEQHRRFVDISLIGVILVLIALVIYLYASR